VRRVIIIAWTPGRFGYAHCKCGQVVQEEAAEMIGIEHQQHVWIGSLHML
jgi:hypothetical protein